MATTTMTLEQALAAAKDYADNSPSFSASVARSYIRTLQEAEAHHGEVGRKVQLLYILNNLRSWRGKVAREAKTVMRREAR